MKVRGVLRQAATAGAEAVGHAMHGLGAIEQARGGLVVREAGPMKHGTTVIAFVEDPDGYKIELIQQDQNARNN